MLAQGIIILIINCFCLTHCSQHDGYSSKFLYGFECCISRYSVFILLSYFRPTAERAQADPGYSRSGVGQDGGMGQFREGGSFSAGIGFFPSLFGLQFVSTTTTTFILLLPCSLS